MSVNGVNSHGELNQLVRSFGEEDSPASTMRSEVPYIKEPLSDRVKAALTSDTAKTVGKIILVLAAIAGASVGGYNIAHLGGATAAWTAATAAVAGFSAAIILLPMTVNDKHIADRTHEYVLISDDFLPSVCKEDYPIAGGI